MVLREDLTPEELQFVLTELASHVKEKSLS